MTDSKTLETVTKLIGQYLIDHADELIVTECLDMMGDEIFIRIIRRKDKEGKPE